MILLKDVDFSYGEKQILNKFNLTVADGECVCLKSPSGGGKTTVFRIISGLESADFGEVDVPKKLSVVFQEDRLLEAFSVKTNVTLSLPKERYAYAISLLKQVGLGDVVNTPVHKLSGGMKRRVAVVKAIAFSGDALLLDEPFNGIDFENKKIIAEIIKTEVLEKNVPVLISTHVKEDADLLCARTVTL